MKKIRIETDRTLITQFDESMIPVVQRNSLDGNYTGDHCTVCRYLYTI